MNVEFYVEETIFKQFGTEFSTDKYVTPMEWYLLENEVLISIRQFFDTKNKHGSVNLKSTSISFSYSVLPVSRCNVKIESDSSYFMKVTLKNYMNKEVIPVIRSSTRISTRSSNATPNFIKERKIMAENQKAQKTINNKLQSRKTNTSQAIKKQKFFKVPELINESELANEIQLIDKSELANEINFDNEPESANETHSIYEPELSNEIHFINEQESANKAHESTFISPRKDNPKVIVNPMLKFKKRR